MDGASRSGKQNIVEGSDGIKTSLKTGNMMLTLCHQATYLLNKQIEALEEKHLREGGYSEKLYNRRKEYIKAND